jgi:DNA modification methylase
MIEMWDEAFARDEPAVAAALHDGDGPGAFEAMHRGLDAVWRECHRVLVPGGIACINIGDATRTVAGRFRLYANHSRVLHACVEAGFEALPLILWRKQTNAPNKFMGSGMLPAGAYVTLEHEYVLVLRKGAKREFTGADRARRRKSAFFWEERNRWFTDVWDFKGVRQGLGGGSGAGGTARRERSAAFPVELAYRLVNMYSLRGDVVLDPFLGTGTTTVAAITAARNSVGVDIDPALATVVGETVAGAAAAMNTRIEERLSAHHELVAAQEEARGAPLKHENENYGFRVMTAQERRLTLSCVTAIERAGDNRLTARHRDLVAADLDAPLPPPELTGFDRLW